MTEISYFTEEGLQKLRDEVADLTSRGRAEMARQIQEARDKGDLSENAEYDAAKEAQGLLELKISKLETTLANARVLDESQIDLSIVQPLSKVRVKNSKTEKEKVIQLVSETEADFKANRLSVSSPIGKGLLGKKVGDIATINVPAGLIEFEILEISM